MERTIKGGVEGSASPAIAVPLFLDVRNAAALHRITEPGPYIGPNVMNLDHTLCTELPNRFGACARLTVLAAYNMPSNVFPR